VLAFKVEKGRIVHNCCSFPSFFCYQNPKMRRRQGRKVKGRKNREG
jgi:hypothetical protein